ncbi:MAG TPA: hypothetical protein VMA09_23130 [Candidatus Binataceae bacterium]|nr:hypothetical protein [Candidatus Binataceae bacterium]
MKLLFVIAVGLALFSAGCTSQSASDPNYGQMFKKATNDRVHGTEFWGSNQQKDCVSAGNVTTCAPSTQPPG